MTKQDKIKAGIAAGCILLAVVALLWYLFGSAPTADVVEPLPEGLPNPNMRTVPGGG